MAEIWPSELQDYVDQASFTQTPRSVTLKSSNEAGPSKRRRRFSKIIKDLNVSILVDRVAHQVFEDFFDTTLGAGTKSFAFNDPITEIPSEFKIDSYSTAPVGSHFRITMTWEKQP